MQSSILETLLQIVHVFVCLVLMFVVLLQQGRGGGMGAAFGGGAAAQVFGGRGAGNILTRATSICAGVFMLTSVSLAYISSSGDRSLRAKAASEDRKRSERGTKREKDKPAAPKEETPPAGGASGPGGPTDNASSGAAPQPGPGAAPSSSSPQ